MSRSQKLSQKQNLPGSDCPTIISALGRLREPGYTVCFRPAWAIRVRLCLKKKALHNGISLAVGCVKIKLDISFPATHCQKLTEVTMAASFTLFTGSY